MEPPQKRTKSDESSASDPESTKTVVAAPPVDDHNTYLFNFVFGIDFLREKIIDLAIHNGVKLSRANAYSCRLVQRSWHESVSKCLIDAGTPLFILTIQELDLAPTSLVNRFLDDAMSPSRIFPCVPPFSLNLMIRNKGPQEKVQNCLRHCGSGLLSLDMRFDDFSLLLPEPLPNDFSFPVLQKLTIFFYRRSCDMLVEVENVTSRLQLILSASPKLAQLCLDGNDELLVRFSDLCLPVTVRNLELLNGLTFEHLEELSVSNGIAFQKLTHLALGFKWELYDGKDSIYRILKRVRHTLKSLQIDGELLSENAGHILPLHLPTMKNLVSLTIDAINYEWTKNANLERRLPVVKTIVMDHMSPINLRQLVEWSRFENVEELVVSYYEYHTNAHFSAANEDVRVTLQKLPLAFPNLTILDMSIGMESDLYNSFHSIFQNMTQLQKLSVHIFWNRFEMASSQFWDMMFLGMLPEEMNASNVPYITNLSVLRVLKIHSEHWNGTSLLDAVFEDGFLRMPKLLNVALEGYFEISLKVRERWRQEGREEIYTRGYKPGISESPTN